MADRSGRPPIALVSDAGCPGSRRIAEAELQAACELRTCGRLDEFCEVVAETHLGVVVGERRWGDTVIDAVSESSDSDTPPALVMVIDETVTEEGEASEGGETVPASRRLVVCDRLALWQAPGSLLRTVTAALIRDVLDGCQREVLHNRTLRERSPDLWLALIRVFERTEPPVVEVQELAHSLPGGRSASARSLRAAWAMVESASELGLKQLLGVVVLLRALLLHVEPPELSWSEVALKSGVILRTLRRYMKRYAGVTPSRIASTEIPALASELERRVMEALR